MASTPQFSFVPAIGSVIISTANANRDGTGTVGTVITGATRATGASPAKQGGTRIDWLTVTASSTTTAGMIRLFIYDGANYRFWQEISVTAITPSATVSAFTATIYPSLVQAFNLPDGYSIRASTEKAESFHVLAGGGDL